MMKRKINIKKLLLILGVVVVLAYIYFSLLALITPDSVGYYSYLNIFRGSVSMSNWNTIRGPVMPLILFLITTIFGDNQLGFIIGTFIFYIVTLFVSYKIIKIVLKEEKKDKISSFFVWILFICFIVFNPIIIGYYHVMLTEFVAATAAVLSSFLSFKWINVQFIKNKVKFLLYLILFSIFAVFMWFLKQPYVIVVIIPFFIATVLSMIKHKNWWNSLTKIAASMIVLISIFVGIVAWNKILEENNVKSVATSTETYMTNGMIAALTDFPEIKDDESHSITYVESSVFLDSKEKNMIEGILNGESNYHDYDIYEVLSLRKGIVIDEIVVPYKEKNSIGYVDTLEFFKIAISQYPLQVFDSYASDYLAVVGILPFKLNTVSSYYAPVKIQIPLYQFWNENLSIGLGTYFKGSTFLDGTPDMDYIIQYKQVNPSSYLKTAMIIASKFAIISYKVVFILAPILAIALFVKYLFVLKNKHNYANLRILEICIILFGFSFLHVMFHVMTGLVIDRYSFAVYPVALIGLILCTNYFLVNKRTWNKIRDFFKQSMKYLKLNKRV